MSGSVKITGCPTPSGPDGSFPIRREIRELQANSPDQFNMFVLGMRAFQGVDENQLLSYYQIAGIHGEPFKAWDNVKGISNWDFGGYCTHSSVLFAPWHRPYLALFEQALYAVAQGIAQKFPAAMRDRYVQAAKTVRLPYYDWAMRPPPAATSAFPDSLSSARISVVDVDGVSKQIDNPLYQFNFHPANPAPGDFDAQWSSRKTTVRYPDSSGGSRDAMVARVLTNENDSLRRNVSLVLLSYHDFDAFSNNQWRGADQSHGSFGSLEDMHNEIHDKTGGAGHMAALEVAAFDPLFWLHHCNVDRLWAIWQDLNPTAYISPRPAPTSTFSTRSGTVESQDTPLMPFWDRSGTKFWTGAQVKSPSAFGYAYPETQRWKYSSTQAYSAALKQSVSSLYGGNVFQAFAEKLQVEQPVAISAMKMAAASPAATAVAAKPVATAASAATAAVPAAEQKPLVHTQAHAVAHDDKADSGSQKAAIPASLAHLAPENKYTEWIVNVRAVKHVLGQTYRLLVFDGKISPDPKDWDVEYNCVGRVTVLGRASSTPCGKCQDDAASDLQVTGTVPLTLALLQDNAAGHLQNLDSANVVPYLRDNLKYRVTLFGGEERPIEQVPGLKIAVCSTQASIGPDGTPHYSGEYVVHGDITAGLPAGIGQP